MDTLIEQSITSTTYSSTKEIYIPSSSDIYTSFLISNYGINVIRNWPDMTIEEIATLSFEQPTHSPYDAVHVNNHIYIGIRNFDSHLRVLDLNDPFNPTELFTTEIRPVTFITATDSLLITSSGNLSGTSYGDIGIYNISNPANIDTVVFHERNSEITAFNINNQYAYITEDDSTLSILNVLAPDIPFIENTVSTRATANDIYVINNLAYIANGDAGIQILDISDPSNISEINHYETPSLFANKIKVIDNKGYVASNNGLFIFDVSNPESILELGFHQLSQINDISIKNNFAYISSENSIRILDVTDPSLIIQKSAFNTDGSIAAFQLKNNHIFCSQYSRFHYLF